MSGIPIGQYIRVKFVITNPNFMSSISMMANDNAAVPISDIERSDFFQENPLK